MGASKKKKLCLWLSVAVVGIVAAAVIIRLIGPAKPQEESTDSNDESEENVAAGSISEGTVIRLSESTNIRSDMSETSEKIGTVYSGEKVTVVMSYAEGWTKVTWNGKTGYIKTSLLQ